MKRKKAKELPPLLSDSELHKAIDDSTLLIVACRKALESGVYDQIQVMLLECAILTCQQAKDSFSLHIQFS
jgi:hypothetical protein